MINTQAKTTEVVELTILERFPKVTGKSRLDLLAEEIRIFLYSKIRSKIEPRMYITKVEGHKEIFTPFDNDGELGLHGGQISICAYTSKKKDEVIFTGVNQTGIEAQANGFWEIMDPKKGYIEVHFVYFEGPLRSDPPIFGSVPIYDGSDMTAYRFRFKLQRRPKSLIVVIYELSITTEKWNRHFSSVRDY